ncbi:MAG: DUF3488 domain-containing protein [Wenzhouxiangella sp.]|nr:MAG: DUF3488 domain-containing protein [Wenzhouxiangella sp.]
MNLTSPASAVYWTLIALTITASPHLMAMPPWLGGLFLVMVAWRWLAASRSWSAPPTALRLFISLILLILVFVASGGHWSRRAATTLLCMMMAAKLMEMFQPRDLRLVAALCFFMMTAQFLFNERLVYLFYLGLGAWTATMALVSIQRLESTPLQQPDRPWQGKLIDQSRQAAGMLVLALPVAALLFVLFPRLAQPLWGLPQQSMDGRTGLSDELTAGSIANLFLDDRPAFRVEFPDGQPPPVDARYWRGPVLTELDGSTWRRSQFADASSPLPEARVGSEFEHRIQLEPHERRWLFALDHPRSGPEDSRLTTTRELLARNPITALTQYDAWSVNAPFGPQTLPASARAYYLALPEGRNPRTRDFANELRQSFPDDDAGLAAHVLEWFREEPFRYSLATAPLGRHNADEFLFDLRDGYCEYYASAFAILMRAANIPSRVVLGYMGGDWQEGGQYLLVRQSDAHAWTELWIDDAGWVRVDPTAAVSPERIDYGARGAIREPRHALDNEWLRNLRNRLDRAQHTWNRWILGFDAARQQRMLERLGLPRGTHTTLAVIMVIALALVTLALALLLWRRDRQPPRSAAERAWRMLLSRLGRRGMVKKPGETPREFAHRIQTDLAAGNNEFRQLAELYSRVHYGPPHAELAQDFIDTARRFKP